MHSDKRSNTKNKLLIFGYMGMTPTAVHAVLHAFREHFAGIYSQVDIFFGISAQSKHSFQILKEQKLSDIFNFIEPYVFNEETRADYEKEILSLAEHYEQIVFLTKGGMNRWVVATLLKLKSSGLSFRTLQSDGNNAILCDKKNIKKKELPLASLSIDDYLKMLNAGKRVGESEFSIAPAGDDYLLENAVLKSGDRKLEVMAICTIKNHLRVWIDASEWGKFGQSPQEYINRWRTTIEIIQQLKIKKSHAVFYINSGTPTKTRSRIRSEGFLWIDFLPTMASIKHHARQGHDTRKVSGARTPKNVISQYSQLAQPKTLILAQTALSSTSTLTALVAHGVANNIILYDSKSDEIKEAASRIQELAQKSKPGSPLYGCVIKFVPTDHISLLEGLCEVRAGNNSLNEVEINITPGTKEQAIAMAIAANGPTQIIELKNSPKGELTLKNCINGASIPPADFPQLEQVAYFCGGSHSVRRIFTMENTSKDVRKLSGKVFKHLKKLKLAQSLSSEKSHLGSPVHCKGGILSLSGEPQCDLHEIFFNSDKTIEMVGDDEWLELFVATEMLKTGAHEVWQGVKWQWQNDDGESFRDELDVLARFGSKIYSISCKTSYPNPEFEIQQTHCWNHHYEHNYVTQKVLGSFSMPLVAYPASKPKLADTLPPNLIWLEDLCNTKKLRNTLKR